MTGAFALAQGIAQASRQAGQDTPAVRGADWQTATVTAVGSDGTVNCGTIRARRLDSYTNPAVGDQIVITQSGLRNWLALGRTTAGLDPAWQAYTVAWTAATTNPTLGNGVMTGRYARIGRTCHVAIRLVPGSTTAFGTGNYLFSVPFPSADDIVEYLGTARLTAGSTYIGQCVLGPGASVLNATFPASATPATAANLSGTAPATFAAGHILRIALTYQTA